VSYVTGDNLHTVPSVIQAYITYFMMVMSSTKGEWTLPYDHH